MWWHIKRVYECESDNEYDFTDAMKRSKHVTAVCRITLPVCIMKIIIQIQAKPLDIMWICWIWALMITAKRHVR